MQSLLEMIAYTKHKLIFFVATEGYTISENRSYLAVQAINYYTNYLLFIDDDMIFPPDTLDRLLAHKKEIVGVVSHSRCLPLRNTVQLLDKKVLKHGEEPKELFEVMGIGGGIMLINLGVFGEITKPWFSTKIHQNGCTQLGEDAWFCEKARKRKLKVWCDPTIEVKHIGERVY